MIAYVTLPLLSLFIIVVQKTLPEILFFHKVGLEISLVLVVYAGFHISVFRGALLAFFSGFLLDCLSGSLTGFFTTVYVLLYFLAYLVSLRVDTRRTPLIMAFTACCVVLEGAMIMLFYRYIYEAGDVSAMAGMTLLQAAVLGAASPLFFHFFHQFEVTLRNGRDPRPHRRS